MVQRLVLVVDDQEDNRRILDALLQHGGFAVLTADSSPDAIDLAGQHRPDLILLDLMMPGIDGWATIDALRERPDTRSIPIMAVTAKDEAGLEKDLRDAGFCAYLKKPFLPREALDAVHRCLEGESDGWVDLPNYESSRRTVS